MKKIIFTLLFTALISISASGALIFERVGGDITYGATGSNYAYAYFKNTGSTPVGVRFKRTVNVLPNEKWTSSICVGLCYAPFVDQVPLDGDPAWIIGPGQQDTMDITYYSPTLGVADVVIRMYNDDNVNEYVDRSFALDVNSVGINNISSLAESYSLNQNYPNPFNPSTNINFSIPGAGNVNLKVYDVLGNEVASLLNNEKLQGGKYSIDFNASNLSSGFYYYSIKVNDFTDTKKMILIK